MYFLAWLRRYKVLPVSHDWVVDCICMYQLISVLESVMIELPVASLKKYHLPDELLQPPIDYDAEEFTSEDGIP